MNMPPLVTQPNPAVEGEVGDTNPTELRGRSIAASRLG